MDRQPCVYILASGKRGTLYTGVTSNLIKRIWQHKHHIVEGFTDRYNVHLLVWFELRHHGVGDTSGKGHQKLEARLENPFD